ncbi:MAG: insulinase family protein [Gemmatimonadaceae bacterium]
MRLILAALALPLAASVAQQAKPGDSSAALTAKLPVDSKVKVGTLPNGLRYYIRKNVKPEKRAELRLVVNAGSILEKDSQRGYAHFVEHTAFNGTRHFARNDLVKYLQSIGVRFGADLNAYTSFDETVYILPIPTDTPRIVTQAFTILEDWAHGQIFDSSEVIAERGVVHEEWRGSKGAGERMLQQFLPIALKNSLYARRLPIGTEQTIMAATPANLRPFYRDWYQPDLMAVIAVGDFDPAAIESKIRTHFSRIPRNPQAPKRPVAPIPGNQAPLIAIASDKEAVTSDVSLLFKLPKLSTTTVGDYRRDLVGQLYLQMLNSRLSEITQKPDAPFTGAGASMGGFVGREIETFSLNASVQDGGIERGLEALLLEARRVDQFGFLASELDRARTNMLRGYELANAEREKTPSEAYAEEYIRAYLEGEAIPGIEYEYATVRRLLPSITLNDVNRLAARWITDENRVVIARSPIKEGVALPTESGILAVFDRASKSPVIAYTENVSEDALVDALRPAGSVVSVRSIPIADVTEWKLSNGARVLVKPTDFQADEVRFGAYSPGGTSLASDADFMSAAVSPQIVGLSGLGKFNLVDLGKKLAGKATSVSPSVSEMSEGMNGSASPQDLETLLQLVYLHFTGARVDTTAFAAFRNNVGPFLANRGADPGQVFRDTVQVTMSQYGFRARPVTPATFSEVSAHKAIGFFRDRFADAGDFTFVFVGNVDTTTLRPLVERYLASLPTIGRRDSAKVVSLGPPKGVVQKTVRKGVENKATSMIAFTGPCSYTPETRFAIRALVDAFQLRLTESLREKLGGTYSPGVSGNCSRSPRQEYTIQISFESSPDNVETLTRAVFALIDTLKTQGPQPSDVDKVREQITRSREVEVKQNSYWLNNIMAREQAGEDIGGLLTPYDEMVKKLTASLIQEAAKRYLDAGNYARFVLLPENK